MSDVISAINETRRYNNHEYRKWFKETQIPKLYHPVLHVLFNVVVLLSLVVGNALMIESWNWGVLGVYAFTLLLGNFTVWAIHRYPLHHRGKIISFPYDRHTVMHHRYFTSDFITFDDITDLVAIFFPMSVVFGFAVFVVPGFYFGFKYFFGSNLAFAFASGTSMYFLLYEFVHWASHLSANHIFIKYNPWLRAMRSHHLIHHNPKLMMKYNFCIVYPLMDYVMGTRYKEVSIPKDDFEDHYIDVKANLP